MLRVGFEPTVSASARAKTVHALHRSATVTGRSMLYAADNYRVVKSRKKQNKNAREEMLPSWYTTG
jgi:hypothetical protein